MNKILVIRFSSIGDIVLTSPIVRCLKKQVPGSEVHFLTKRAYREIVENNPFVDKVFFLDQSLEELIPSLKKESYDYVIDLHHNLRSWRVKSRLGKKNFSFPKLNFEKWLIVNFKINTLPNVHIVDRYFETVKSLGVKNDGAGLDFFIPGKDEVDIKTLSLEKAKYIAFAIGGKFATKKLPLEKIRSICSKINLPIVLLGGKEDLETGQLICDQTDKMIINACGKFSLSQSASIIRQSQLLITHDTGLMHIGAALKKEMVSIWGNTIPEFGMAPYYGEAQVLNIKTQVPGLSCRPCSKLGFEKCPKGHFKCMNLIDEKEISDFVNRGIEK